MASILQVKAPKHVAKIRATAMATVSIFLREAASVRAFVARAMRALDVRAARAARDCAVRALDVRAALSLAPALDLRDCAEKLEPRDCAFECAPLRAGNFLLSRKQYTAPAARANKPKTAKGIASPVDVELLVWLDVWFVLAF